MTVARRSALPPSLPPRGLDRAEAAAYVGVGTSLFDRLVGDGRMPAPKRIDGRLVWDRRALDAAFDALPDLERRGNAPADGPADVWSRVRA